MLPAEVALVAGRIANRHSDVTVLHLARAFAHLVANERPEVINLSLAPRDDVLICPHCKKAVPVPAFHSLILPYVFDLAGSTTATVMAAGNSGRQCNARHYLGKSSHLIFASATGSSGEPAPYSNYVDGTTCLSLAAFGGDPPSQEDGQSLFSQDRSVRHFVRRSFVSAAVFFGKARQREGKIDGAITDLMAFCSDALGTGLAFDPQSVPPDAFARPPAQPVATAQSALTPAR